jgi:signal transduction histidine kinase
MVGERIVTQTDYRRVEVGARLAALVLVLVLSVVTGSGREHPASVLFLALLAVAGAVPVGSRSIRRWRPVVEEAVAAAIVASTQPHDPALLPYLVVPALSAGLIGGWTLAVITTGAGAIVLLSRGLLDPDGLADSTYLVDVSQWVLLALAIGLLGSWLRRVQSERSTDAENYAQASRLLAQLRDVSRQLSGGLDAVSLATSELESLQLVCPYQRGSVFVRSPGGLLVLLATDAPDSVDWQPDLTGESPWADVWRTHEPHRSRTGFNADSSLVSLALPLRLGGALIGLVGLERSGTMFARDEVAAAMRLLDDGAARLDAALLFDEVRGIATAEERRRVAREIHDGIAQELASLGYAVDGLTARAGQDRPDLVGPLRELRTELTRVITELRLSIFDLRTDVGPHTSLTAVLADHARTVGAQSGLTVHLELAETPARLRVETETELLRIAQEAIANARKHAEARNLWVTCRIAAPEALLRIEDDGRGITPGREDSFGFEIMKERAERVGGRLQVTGRPGGGTVVLVTTEPTTGERTHGDQRAARR